MEKIMSEKKYSEDHEWVTIQNDIATIGISNHAQESLGDIVFIEMPVIGSHLNTGDEAGVVESVKAASDIFSPVTGEVVEINKDLESKPALLNTDPEASGWIFKIDITDKNEFNSLMDIETYTSYLENL